jgi:uncharacterized membrane protein YeaQ/YmgE (transglycosylase-associated protein family)
VPGPTLPGWKKTSADEARFIAGNPGEFGILLPCTAVLPKARGGLPCWSGNMSVAKPLRIGPDTMRDTCQTRRRSSLQHHASWYENDDRHRRFSTLPSNRFCDLARISQSQDRKKEEVVTMYIIWALIVGLIVGAIAKLLMPGRDPGGVIITMLLGIAGSFVASVVGRALGFYRASDVGPGVIASVLGAIVVLAVYRAVVHRRVV